MPAQVEESQTDELEQQDGLQPEGGEAEGETTKPAPNAELTKAMQELAAEVKSAVAPKKEDEEKLTPEQIEELWGVFKPETTRPDFMKKFFRLNPEATEDEVKEARELFDMMQQGLVRQAVTGARNYMTVMERKLRDEFKEALDFVSEVKAERLRKQFQEEYPALADAKYAKIVQVQAKLLASKTFESSKEYFKELAESSAEAIKAIVPEFELGKAPEKKPAATTPKLPRTTQGGGGGAGKGGGDVVKTSRSDSDSLL